MSYELLVNDCQFDLPLVNYRALWCSSLQHYDEGSVLKDLIHFNYVCTLTRAVNNKLL